MLWLLPLAFAAPDGVVIMLEDGADLPADASDAEALGGPFYRVPSDDPFLDAPRWLQRREVALADPDVVVPKRPASFDDPLYGAQWYLDNLGMEALWERSLGDPSVRVAVVDSGIAIGHPDLADAVVEPYDAFSDDEDPSPDPGAFCRDGESGVCDTHGTAVSGIIAARADNGIGIAGLCPTCSLVPIKLLGDGGGSLSADVRAFEHAIAADASVINNSWGFTEPRAVPSTLAAAIHRAATVPRDGLGAVVVFAAGNDDRDVGDEEMQALPEVLCVAGTDLYGQPVPYTNRGEAMDVAAPSATVSLGPDGGTIRNFGGTSAAAPVVSGVAAWVVAVAPDMSAARVRNLITTTARPSPLVTHDERGHNPIYGYGELDPVAILDTLFPPDDVEPEMPRACACSSASPAALAPVLPLLVLAMWRRRRIR